MGFLGEQFPKPLRSPLRSNWPLRYVSQRWGGWRPLKLFPCHYDGSFSAAINVAAVIEVAPLRYDRSSGGTCFYCFSMFSFAGVKLWLNCQPGVLSWDLGHSFFWLLSCKFLWGLFRWILWLSGSPGKEHHARLVQGLSNWQVWAASPLATICCIWSSGYTFG